MHLRHPPIRTLMHMFLVRHALGHCIIGIHLFHLHKSLASKQKLTPGGRQQSKKSRMRNPLLWVTSRNNHIRNQKGQNPSHHWVLSQLQDLAAEAGIGILKQWTHNQKQWEATKDLVQLLLNIPTNEALDWLEDLHEPKRFMFRATRRTDQELNVQIKLQDLEKGTIYQTQALLDSSCTGSCISQWFAEEKKLSLHRWEHPITVYNTDGTENSNGKITHYMEMKMIVNRHSEIRKYAVTNLGWSDVFLGHEWLNFHNPEIDWNTGSLWFTRCPAVCGYTETEDVEEGDRIWMKYPKPPCNVQRNKAFIWAYQFITNSLAEEFKKNKKTDPILEQYKGFEEVFEKAKFDMLPPRQPWDHTIKLKQDQNQLDAKYTPWTWTNKKNLTNS